jgi:hypothetical protein
MRSKDGFRPFFHRLADLSLILAAAAVALASSKHNPGGRAFAPATANPGVEVLDVETYDVRSDCPGAPAQGTLRLVWKSTSGAPRTWASGEEPLESNAMDLGFPSRTFARVGDVLLNATRLEDAKERVECRALVDGKGGTQAGRLLHQGQGVLFLCVDSKTGAARCSLDLAFVDGRREGGGRNETVARSRSDANPGLLP